MFALIFLLVFIGTAEADWIQCPVRQQVNADGIGGTIIRYSPALQFITTFTAVPIKNVLGVPQSFLIYTNDDTQKEGKCNRLTRTEILTQIGSYVDISFMEKLPQHAYLNWLWNWIGPAVAWAASFGPDAFTRTEAPISTPYDTTTYTGYYQMILDGSIARGSDVCVANNSYSFAEYTGTTFNDNHFAQIQLGAIAGADEIYGAVLLRLTPNGVDPDVVPEAYQLSAWKNNGSGYTSTIETRTTGSAIVIASEGSTTWAATDTIKGQVVGDNLTLFRNGSVLLTAVGGSFITSGGRTGFGMKCSTTAGNMTLDNFSAGDTSVPRRRGGAMVIQ